MKKEKKPWFNVKGWLGYDHIARSAQSIVSLTKDVFSKKKSGEQETFEQAVQRLHLTDADLERRANGFKKYFRLYAILALLVFVYGIVELFFEIRNGILCFGVAAFLGAQAFRQHFSMFQIQQKRLGCTFKEWRDSLTNSHPGRHS